MRITFKSKSYKNSYNFDTIKTPKNISRTNVVKNSYYGEKWDAIINSNILPNLIMKKIKFLGLEYININELPENVSIQDGFLKEVTLDLGASY